MNVKAEIDNLKGRVTVLEAVTISGVPGVSLAERFDLVHLRVDNVAQNLRDHVTSEVNRLEAAMDRRFGQIDAWRTTVDARFEGIDAQFAQIDARFAQIDARFAQIDERFAQIDERFDGIDARFAQVDARFEKIDARFEKIDGDLTEIKSLLVALVAGKR
ncbi:hypothetical protein ACIBH1_22360 [Nonomuraea sp. NPDC050663]|uniref:hypothetical protein n=1 Tax=Nonomuraea sp. NPDC050663 TaxID=3364370 RepID=UPI0037A3537F